ncbi:MAG: T9SS type A sorting domain-containing protein [Prevotella sp.]|nr:T9SS type A sorting domain-containing protein [Prevotella sp.]
MKRKRLLTILLSSFLSLGAMAEGEQQLTINGNIIDLVAVNLTFNGDQVTLKFTNNTTMDVDMALVKIIFPTGVSTIIGNLQTYELKSVVEDGILRVRNIKAKTPLSVFNSNGQEVARTVSQEQETTVDLSNQPAGVYLLRAGSQVIKFVKK